MRKTDTTPTEDLLYIFGEGNYYHAYHIFGSHKEKDGVRFTVWAPFVKSVSVIGDWNNWSPRGGNTEEGGDYLLPLGMSGCWSGVIKSTSGRGTKAKGPQKAMCYKYLIETQKGKLLYKADPYAIYSQKRPETASIIWDLKYKWEDAKWMASRKTKNHFKEPCNIYEVHLGSWKRHLTSGETLASEADPDNRNCTAFYTYRELAETLVPYAKKMGYTHLEILPVMEHPLDASWGYQTTGFFSATSRYGTPQDLMYFIDTCHREGLAVILDWVPGHFCRDEHGLCRFNGQKLYEEMEHPNWGTFKFDFGRGQVRSFLLSSAMFWLEQFHADGIRVDGVSSILYMNFGIDDDSKKRFNKDGTEGDLNAISFFQDLARMVGTYYPEVYTIAEESTAWPLVTYPPDAGGLGFHYKWDMGWMNDTLRYMQTDFPSRSEFHSLLSFSMMYAFNENFILPLSHDEVVHGKKSLIGRMPGDYWRQFANLRLLLLYQMTHPGKKLTFMGSEIAQFIEWREYEQLEWFLLDYESHKKHQQYVKALNHFYKKEKALTSCDHDWSGFTWLDADNAKQNVISYIRTADSGRSFALCALNFGVQTYKKFRIGVPKAGTYKEVFNSDMPEYGGSGQVMDAPVKAEKIPMHGQPYSIEITIPPVGGTIWKLARAAGKDTAKKPRATKSNERKPVKH